ncbi:MFS transporter, UMF1 family [Desulfocicer vacuolatum DSM 3385]|uniref:MFS transporter, UMF1 family n=1 Tax=Desulfocicer vacuolatum DSM 3385 TaxID=1121400 RepID=A0A1W2E2X1_9BACT|nr:MFS transporter [Desulfocicer vacuolatum]SMD03606.1 MFS transporter, UMF1 family [Desulfocicer vacuolatum DSM 3385]
MTDLFGPGHGAHTKEETGWILYDVGNSAFVLVMITAVMPVFFKDVAAAGLPNTVSTAYWGFANAGASFILAFLSPVLGAMADYQDKKKTLFLCFLGLGLFFTLALMGIGQGMWGLCLAFFVLARVGWAGANLFYDAFLVDVTPRERMDLVSSRGYAWGYIGSVVPFLFILWRITATGDIAHGGLPVAPTRMGFMVVAVWWFLFSLPLMKTVQQKHAFAPSRRPVRESFRRLWHTFQRIRTHQSVFMFLGAYFFYIDGVGTIISMSTAYGRDLGFSVTMLIVVILFIQIIAFPFALVYGKLARRFSPKTMLMWGIAVYCVITFMAFWLPQIHSHALKVGMFWGIAFLVASSMGGIQALSRSFFASLIPMEQSGEFFGFFNVFGKFAAISGPLLMGGIAKISGHTRWGVLSLLLLFTVGLWLLNKVDVPDSRS